MLCGARICIWQMFHHGSMTLVKRASAASGCRADVRQTPEGVPTFLMCLIDSARLLVDVLVVVQGAVLTCDCGMAWSASSQTLVAWRQSIRAASCCLARGRRC